METAIEQPPQVTATFSLKPRITPANAREYQLRAAQARVHNKLAKKLAESAPVLANLNEPRIALVERELARVGKMMSQTTDASDYHKLANARGTLFKEWQVLSGTPNPGSAKSKRSAKPAMIQPEPIPEPQKPQ